MLICICHSLNEDTLREAADNGSPEINSLSSELGLGQDCGKCLPAAKKLLEKIKSDRPDSQPGSSQDC